MDAWLGIKSRSWIPMSNNPTSPQMMTPREVAGAARFANAAKGLVRAERHAGYSAPQMPAMIAPEAEAISPEFETTIPAFMKSP